jgi:kynurenine formamidase
MTAEHIPAGHLVGEAVVVDIAAAVAEDADYRLTVDDVEAWERRQGELPNGGYVLIQSGWASRWDDPDRYLGRDAEGGLHHPACTPEAARRLVGQGVAGLGIDTLSVDNGRNAKGAAHAVLHAAGRTVLENLARTDELPPRGILLIIGALPIRAGTGAPARVLAFCDAGSPGMA